MYWLLPAVVALWLSYLLVAVVLVLCLMRRWAWTYRASFGLAVWGALTSAAGAALGLVYEHQPLLLVEVPAAALEPYHSAFAAMTTQSFRVALIALGIALVATGVAIFARRRHGMLTSIVR